MITIYYEGQHYVADPPFCFFPFPGIISRQTAEDMLETKSVGNFLVRVSERVWGYVLSYKDEERVKHFLIDASGSGYQFFGNESMSHVSLYDLVQFHRVSTSNAFFFSML